MGLKSFLQSFGLFKNKENTPAVVESPVRPEKVEAQIEAPVIAEVKAEEPTKVMVDRLVEVSEKKEEAKVTAKDIKAKSKKVQKPVENKPQQQAKKPNPNQKPNQAKKPNPNQKPAQRQNQKPSPKKG